MRSTEAVAGDAFATALERCPTLSFGLIWISAICLVIPIIVITGHADAQTCRTALHNGVFDFVEKSFNPHDLLVVIQAAIEESTKLNHERRVRDLAKQQVDHLSKREAEVMKLLITGLSLKAIASELGISVQTASKHRIRLFEKLEVHNEVELVKLMMRINPMLPLTSYNVA